MPEETVTVSTPPPAGAPPASASGTITLPKAGDGTPPPAATSPAFAIPDAYKDRPWAKGIDSVDKAFAMLDGAETKLGQRPAGIPADTSTPEEWRKFWTSMGAPEKAEGYQFDFGKDKDGKPIEGDAKWVGGLKQIMYEEGLTAKQALGLQKRFDAHIAATMKEKGIAEQQLNADFDKIGTELYGAERDKVIARVAPLLKEFTSPKMQPGLAKLSPEALMIMTNVVDNIRSKFIKSEAAPSVTPGGTTTGNAESLRAEARALMQTPAYTNAFDPNNKATVDRINELYKQASQIK